jgi:hypothetical protein
MFDIARLQPLADRVIDQALSGGFESLDERDQVLFLLWSYPAMVDNGGFPAFFYNSTGDYYLETAGALRQLGLQDHAELLGRAAAILFGSDVPLSTEARCAVIDQVDDDALMDREMDGELEELYAAYANRGGGDGVLGALQDWYFAKRI